MSPWIDYNKGLLYDLANLEIERLKMYKISDSHKLHHESYGKLESRNNSWWTNSSRGGNPKKHLPWRLTHLPLLFLIAMMPLNYAHWKYTGGYKFTKLQEKITPLSMWMIFASSSCRAASRDLPDFLSPPVSIVHSSREVFKAISCIGTELLYIGSSCSSCLCSSMCRGPQEYVDYEFVLTSLAVSRMSSSSNWDSFRDGWSVAA